MLVLKFVVFVLLCNLTRTSFYSKSHSLEICSRWSENWRTDPESKNFIFTSVKLLGGKDAGKYSKVEVDNWYECVAKCCQFSRCNVAFWIASTCLHVECVSDDLCQPASIKGSEETFYAKVRSVRNTAAAIDYEDPGQDQCNETRLCKKNEKCEQISINAQLTRRLCLCNRENGFRRINGICRQYSAHSEPCELYVTDDGTTDDENTKGLCQKNEECLPPNDRAKHGYCQCKLGYLRSSDTGKCIEDKDDLSSAESIIPSTKKIFIASSNDLEVDAGDDQTIVFPIDHVDLVGHVLFKTNRTEVNKSILLEQNQTVVWSLKSSSKNLSVDIITDQDSPCHATVKNLQNGLYEFELKLLDRQGSMLANDYVRVQVISEQTTTSPPSLILKVISPIQVQLPQQFISLQATVEPSSSRVNYRWTYLGDGPTTPTLENAETSDLSVSNLRPGNYSFQIHVTDSSAHELTKTIRVFATGQPIEARVTNTREVVFWPSNDVLLDGTSSIIETGTIIRWSLISADTQQPLNEVEIQSPDSLKSRVSHLHIGQYRFQLLLVTEDRLYTSKIDVLVIVYAQNGRPPKINIQLETSNIHLLNNLIILNATGTVADYGIVRWKWTKSPSSPASGYFINHSDTTAIAYLTDVIEGQYIFTLQVVDDRQQVSEKNISVQVDGIPEADKLIEIRLSSKPYLRQQTLDNLLAQIRVFLIDLDPNIILEISGITKDNLLLFKGQNSKTNRVIPPKLIADHLRIKLKALRTASNVNILSVDTFLCLSNCSNHGKCDHSTKRCICDRYYMENWLKFFIYREQNCDFLIHYFVLLTIAGSLVSFVICCSCLCCCLRWRRRRYLLQRRKRIRYQLLHEKDDNEDDQDLSLLSNTSSTNGQVKQSNRKNQSKNSAMIVSDSENDLSDTNGEQTLYDRPLLTAKFRSSSSSLKGRNLKVPIQDSNGSPVLYNNSRLSTKENHLA